MYVCVGNGFMVFHEMPKITFQEPQGQVTLTNEPQGQTPSLLVLRSESLNPAPLKGRDYTEPGHERGLPTRGKDYKHGFLGLNWKGSQALCFPNLGRAMMLICVDH